MARRIEIELTSARPDGSWTWRAAGAREPRGVLEGGLLPDGAKAGDVLKAEAEFEIEGITIVSVLTPKETTRIEPQRIEILGSGSPEGPGVTTQLVGRADRRPGERRPGRDDGRPRRDREAGRPATGRDATRPRREGSPAEGEAAGRRPARATRPDRSDRPQGAGTAGASDRQASGPRRERPERPDGPAAPGRAGARPARGQGEGAGRRGERATPGTADRDDGAGGGERRARRFSPGRAHRQAMMASLPPEQQPIAEQVLRGGIPAVRTALHLEREKAMAEGRPVPNTDQLVAMAEAILPKLKAAEWRDRAEAAAKDVDDISLRDLRSVVAGADTARDDDTRALAVSLREALDRRVDALRRQWSDEVAKHLDENRVVRALRLAGRPPEPAARLESVLTERLSDAAGQALAPDAPPDRWLAVLDAVAASPVRRSVKPAGLPSDPTPELRRTAHQQSGRVPALVAMLGISIPPPPVPVPPRRPAPPRRRAAAGGSDRPTDTSTSSTADPVPDPAPDPGTGTTTETAADATSGSTAEPTIDLRATPTADPTPDPPSAERGEDAVVVEELGETLGES